jgi:hypothetical protein
MRLAAGLFGDLADVLDVSGLHQVVRTSAGHVHRLPHPAATRTLHCQCPAARRYASASRWRSTGARKPQLLACIADGQEAGCLVGGDLLLQADASCAGT